MRVSYFGDSLQVYNWALSEDNVELNEDKVREYVAGLWWEKGEWGPFICNL